MQCLALISAPVARAGQALISCPVVSCRLSLIADRRAAFYRFQSALASDQETVKRKTFTGVAVAVAVVGGGSGADAEKAPESSG